MSEHKYEEYPHSSLYALSKSRLLYVKVTTVEELMDRESAKGWQPWEIEPMRNGGKRVWYRREGATP